MAGLRAGHPAATRQRGEWVCEQSFLRARTRAHWAWRAVARGHWARLRPSGFGAAALLAIASEGWWPGSGAGHG